MAGKPSSPKNEKEELLFYKGIYRFRQLIDKRVEKMNELNQIDKDIAKVVTDFKPFVSWRELGTMLGMSEFQAKSYLEPLMGEVEK